TGNKPGVTKGKQWIRINKNVELLDTPGILWPKFEDQSVGAKLAMVGSIKDEILNLEELSLELLGCLHEFYAGILEKRYEITESEDRVSMLTQIAENRKCIQKGNELDYGKAANLFLEEFRNGKIGRITLERP
ncbi:MAG: ribosome biogenesis GTPase YlqF, partial [Blautia sp.]